MAKPVGDPLSLSQRLTPKPGAAKSVDDRRSSGKDKQGQGESQDD